MKKILLINGSPNEHGCTAVALKKPELQNRIMRT